MKRAVAIALMLIASPALAQTHNADFPDQERAINQCYVEFINSGSKSKAPPDYLPNCMVGKGFKFCPKCKIFRFSGGPCEADKENRYDRATCWRPQ